MNNIFEANISKKTYKEYFFWEHKIANDFPLWEGNFNNMEICKNSKIVYTGILDSEKNILRGTWATYPDIYTLIGFIQHVFIPTSLFTWFDRNYHEFLVPMSPFHIVLSEVIKTNDINNTNDFSPYKMKDYYSFLDSIWSYPKDLLSQELQSFCSNFNNTWDNDPNKKLFIQVFDNPNDVFNFIKDYLHWDFDEFIQEELSMSLTDFKFTCNNALSEPLINKNFINILNNNIPIIF